MESPQRDPTTPGVAPAPACACLRLRPRVRLPEQIGRTERGRKTGKTGRQGGQPDTLSRTGSFRPCLPRLPCLPTLPASHARLPCPVSRLACLPFLPCPVSRLSRVYHIVNRSATRASRKTAFCQAILLFLDLSKRYILIYNDLRAN